MPHDSDFRPRATEMFWAEPISLISVGDLVCSSERREAKIAADGRPNGNHAKSNGQAGWLTGELLTRGTSEAPEVLRNPAARHAQAVS